MKSRGCLTCEICEHKAELSGPWADGTKLVDDSLSENFHKMGSFLISKIDGVRLAANARSEEEHDVLEFRGLVRGCQPEERQEWIPPLLACGNQRQDGTDQGLLERLWKDREVRPLLLPTRWWPRAASRTTHVPKVGEEMKGFSEEAQGWLPCKIQ